MKMKKLFSGLMVLLPLFMGAVVINANSAEAEETITWRCPTHWPEASRGYTVSLLAVAEKVKERSDGRLIIEPYAEGKLVPGNEVFNAVKRGVAPIGITSTVYDTDSVPLLNIVAGPPFNFKNEWENLYFHFEYGFEEMVKDAMLENHGILYFSDRTFTTELALKEPVESMDDFKGLKLRSSGVLQNFLSSIGASAQYIPGGDLYTALASGMVDGAHWGNIVGNYSMSLYEVCDYHLRTPLNIAFTEMWVINKESFDELPKDLQNILVRTLEEHSYIATNIYQHLRVTHTRKAQEEHDVTMLELSPEEFGKMQKAALEIWDEIAEESPECAEAIEMLKEYNSILGRDLE